MRYGLTAPSHKVSDHRLEPYLYMQCILTALWYLYPDTVSQGPREKLYFAST